MLKNCTLLYIYTHMYEYTDIEGVYEFDHGKKERESKQGRLCHKSVRD